MFDLSLQRICDHRIFDEQLTLQGSSPNYFAFLKYFSNLNTNAMQIREYATTEQLTNYTYTLNGFTNWSVSTDGRQINFNSLGLGGPGTGVAAFADGSTIINPQRIFLATYLAPAANCPLHDAVGQNNTAIQKDINVTPQGTLDTVTSFDKVRQAVLKALLTVLGDNQFFPSYGSLLSSTIGTKFDLLAQFTLQQSIQNSVNYLIQQQQAQPTLPLSETIFKVSSVNVAQSQTDPRTVMVTIVILTGAYQNVQVSFGILT